MVWRWHDFRRVHFYFCLESTLGKYTWVRVASTTVMIIFSKAPFWKLLDHYYAQSCFSNIARHVDKGTLQLKNSRTWIKIHANSFIKTWVNIVRLKSTKVSLNLSITKKYDPALQRTLHQSRWYFTYCYVICFFFS